MSREVTFMPIGHVRGGRKEATKDGWGNNRSRIELPESLLPGRKDLCYDPSVIWNSIEATVCLTSIHRSSWPLRRQHFELRERGNFPKNCQAPLSATPGAVRRGSRKRSEISVAAKELPSWSEAWQL